MRFPHFFIDRPIFAAVLSVLIIVFGLVAYPGLPVAQYPEIAPPTVVVSANYPGATAETLAETVAAPLEESINGVENMIYMSSSSTGDGAIAITVTFKQGTNVDQAQVLVQNRVSSAEPRLPEEVRQIGVTVRKNSPDILLVATLYSPDKTLSQQYISNYATTQIIDRLARIQGVGGTRTFGGRDYNMRVWIDPDLAAARNLTVDEITGAIRAQNAQVAVGSVGQPPFNRGGTAFQLGIQAEGRLTTPEQFGAIIIKRDAEGRLTRLRDLARIELGAQDYGINAFLSGQPTTAIAITQLPGSNALTTAELVKAELKRGLGELPARAELPHPVQPDRIYPGVDRGGLSYAVRGADPGRARRPAVPAELARGADPDHRHSRVARRQPCRACRVRFFDQQSVAVRHGAGDRHRRRRRDRRGGEYRAADGGKGPLAARGRARDDGRGVGRADRDRAGAVRGVHSDQLHSGPFPGQFYQQFALTIVSATAISAFVSLTLSACHRRVGAQAQA